MSILFIEPLVFVSALLCFKMHGEKIDFFGFKKKQKQSSDFFILTEDHCHKTYPFLIVFSHICTVSV